MQRVAGAKAIPDARRADGAPQQARTSPGRNGREGPRRRPARHAADGVQPNSRDNFRVTAKRGVRGCRGCRGDFPLSPHAPRRAGDPPPVPGSSRDAQRNTDSIRPGRFTFFKGETRSGGTTPPGLSFRGKTALFPRNDRPYGLKRAAFQTENAPGRIEAHTVAPKEGASTAEMRFSPASCTWCEKESPGIRRNRSLRRKRPPADFSAGGLFLSILRRD